MTGAANGDGYDKCGATNRAGNPCARPTGWGTAHPGTGRCKLHGGSTPDHVKAANRELARRACDRLGIPIETHPAEALVKDVWETAGNVEFYRGLVAELPTHPEPDEYLPPEGEGDSGHWVRGEPGVYGRTYHQSGLPTGEAKPHVLVQLYNDERKHLLAVTTAALKAGVKEREVRIAEEQGQQIARVVRGVLAELGVADTTEIWATVRRHLAAVGGEGDERG